MEFLDSDIYMDVGDKFYHREKDGSLKKFPSGSDAYYKVIGIEVPQIDKQAFEDAKAENQKEPLRRVISD